MPAAPPLEAATVTSSPICNEQLVRGAPATPESTVFERALVAMFATSLIVISLLTWANSGQKVLKEENRQAYAAPALSFEPAALAAFPKYFEAFFQDHLAKRVALTRVRNALRFKLCGNFDNNYVMLGRNGWLFQRCDTDLFDPIVSAAWRPGELEDYASKFEFRRTWLGQQGISYVLIIVPCKATVYPELLPPGAHHTSLTKKVDELITYLRAHTKLEIIDLRRSLQSHKSAGNLYYALDTHWNTLGATCAYMELMPQLSRLYPQLGTADTHDFDLVKEREQNCDLAGLVGLNGYFQTYTNKCVYKKPFASAYGAMLMRHELKKHTAFCETFRKDKTLPKAVMFRDSMCTLWAPLLSEHFSKITYIWPYTDRANVFRDDVIARDKPDIVLHEIQERMLCQFAPINEICAIPESNVNLSKSQLVYRFSSTDGPSSLVFGKGVHVDKPTDQRLTLRSEQSNPSMLLPETSSGPVRIEVNFYSSSTSVMALQWLGLNDSQYSLERTLLRPTHQGYNSIVFTAPASVHGRMRLTLATEPGCYTIEKLEMRDVSNPAGGLRVASKE